MIPCAESYARALCFQPARLARCQNTANGRVSSPSKTPAPFLALVLIGWTMSDTTTLDEVQHASDISSEPIAINDEVDQIESSGLDEAQTISKEPQMEQTAPVVTIQSSTPPSSRPFQMDRVKSGRESGEKKKDDEKLGIYKALAIKLKKELVKTRDELQKLQDEFRAVVGDLKANVERLETTLESERINHANASITLEANCKTLKSQLETAENDLQALQAEFDSYKTRATKIMQEKNFSLTNSNRIIEEDRYKQLRALNDEQKQQILNLELQIVKLSGSKKELENQMQALKNALKSSETLCEDYNELEKKCSQLTEENESLRQALKQLRERAQETSNLSKEQQGGNNKSPKPSKQTLEHNAVTETSNQAQDKSSIDDDRLITEEESAVQISPSASVKDENHTNSSSSFDSSTYGYVHIKPTAFEIISRTSVLDDAQNQIDNLTKAYLDSENTNSLLTEQVNALKEEIRRIQRGNDRMELANNLEYLKNVLFKFLSLDSGQVEQKQRLVPVLCTILKLSPDETQKLTNLTLSEKGGMTGSFFKL